MAGGLFALLDDVATIAKVAAASLDDAAGQAVKVGGKAAGIVIDDAAVTPRYVVGFAAERELLMIGRIAVGSLKNKLLFLLPVAIGLSAVAPWAITPLLMAGGAFLCFEGAEKAHHLLHPHAEDHEEVVTAADPKALEDEKVAGAIRTDIILSAEIMAISLAAIEAPSLVMQAVILAAVALIVTIGVYGAVALIVKADDAGVALAQDERLPRSVRALGRGLVHVMPRFLQALSVVGTLAMLWVGGGIVVHGLAQFGLDAVEHGIHAVAHLADAAPFAAGFLAWLISATLSGLFGLVLGAAIVLVVTRVRPAH